MIPNRRARQRAGSCTGLLCALLVLATGLAGCGRSKPSSPGALAGGDIPSYGQQASETAYRAVLLSNGQVLFGKLHGLGTPFPVLTDVYYMQSETDPATHKPTTVLIRRGREWHSPDRTVINASQIVLIEPVTEGSKVMDLIRKESHTP